MWKISETRWLNPLMITEVYDDPAKKEIRIDFADAHLNSTFYKGEERQALLNHLARNSTPVYNQRDDDWPFDEDPSRR